MTCLASSSSRLPLAPGKACLTMAATWSLVRSLMAACSRRRSALVKFLSDAKSVLRRVNTAIIITLYDACPFGGLTVLTADLGALLCGGDSGRSYVQCVLNARVAALLQDWAPTTEG